MVAHSHCAGGVARWRAAYSCTVHFRRRIYLHPVLIQMKKPVNPYKEILAISAGFLILSLIARRPVFKQVLFYIGIVVPVLSLLSSFLAEKIVWSWYKVAHALGYINSRILL